VSTNEQLKYIATKTKSRAVAKTAISKITDQATLAYIARNAWSAVEDAAISKITDESLRQSVLAYVVRERKNRELESQFRARHLTLTCTGCKRTYRIGDDAIAVPLEAAFDLVRTTVVVDSKEPTIDLVAPIELSSWSIENTLSEKIMGVRVKAAELYSIIQEKRSRGQIRQWRCKECERVNEYP
jgi:hypothetical protein